MVFCQLLVVDHKHTFLKVAKNIHLTTPLASSRPITSLDLIRLHGIVSNQPWEVYWTQLYTVRVYQALREVILRKTVLKLSTSLNFEIWNLASHRISTRSHPCPNPPNIVDEPENILWQTSRFGNLTTVRTIHREISVPEHLTSLQDPQFDLHHTKNLFKTKSQTDIDQTDLEPIDLQQSSSREASPSTPPDFQLLHHFNSFHLKSAQNQLAGSSTSTTPIHISLFKPLHFIPHHLSQILPL